MKNNLENKLMVNKVKYFAQLEVKENNNKEINYIEKFVGNKWYYLNIFSYKVPSSSISSTGERLEEEDINFSKKKLKQINSEFGFNRFLEISENEKKLLLTNKELMIELLFLRKDKLTCEQMINEVNKNSI
jgi:hypothetical protein